MLRSLVLFTVSVESQFWATHGLTLPDGSREAAHGHNWNVIAEVSGERLNSMGLVMDFRQLREMIAEIVAELRDTPLEQVGYFRRNNPSAENVARYIYEKLETKLPKDLGLESVSVTEEAGCSAKYGR